MPDIHALLSYVLIGLALLLFSFSYKKNSSSKSYRWFLLFLISIICIESISYYYRIKGNNLFLSHVYFFSRFLVLSFFYKTILNKKQNRIIDLCLISVSIIFLSYHIGGYLGYYNIIAFHPIEVFICSMPISVFAVLHTYNSLDNKLSFIYVNWGLLIYITVSTLLFIVAYVLNNNADISKRIAIYLWDLNIIFWIICLLLFIVEWWKNYRVTKIV